MTPAQMINNKHRFKTDDNHSNRQDNILSEQVLLNKETNENSTHIDSFRMTPTQRLLGTENKELSFMKNNVESGKNIHSTQVVPDNDIIVIGKCLFRV